MKKYLISVLSDLFVEASVTGKDCVPEIIKPDFGLFDPASVLGIIPLNQFTLLTWN